MPGREKCPDKKLPLWTVAKVIFGILCGAGAILAFYLTTESRQNARIAETAERATGTEASLSQHLQHSMETFKKLDTTLTAQQALIQGTRETLSGIDATQKAMKSENERLTRSVENLAEAVRGGNRASLPP